MKRTALMFRCVPRYGYDNTEVRTIDLDVPHDATEEQLEQAVYLFFASRGLTEAVYDIAVDDDGFFAVINDEAYDAQWGTPLL